MENIPAELFTKYGWNGVISAVIIFLLRDWWETRKEERKQEAAIEQKKASGDYVDYKDVIELKARMEMVQRHSSADRESLHSHLKDYVEFQKEEAKENIRMGVMENNIQHQGQELSETKEDVKNIYRIMGEIKDLIITQAKNK